MPAGFLRAPALRRRKPCADTPETNLWLDRLEDIIAMTLSPNEGGFPQRRGMDAVPASRKNPPHKSLAGNALSIGDCPLARPVRLPMTSFRSFHASGENRVGLDGGDKWSGRADLNR
jgi:hypothetical protein